MRQKPKPISVGSIWEVQAECIQALDEPFYRGSKYHRGTVPLVAGTKFIVSQALEKKFWVVLAWGKKLILPAFKIHKKCKEM